MPPCWWLAGLAATSVSAAPLTAAVVVSPERFGARGDGVANDHKAFVAALAFLKENGGGTLEGRAGRTYRIDAGLMIEDLSEVVLRGNGATLRRYTPGTAANVLTIVNCRLLTIEGWQFDGGYDGFVKGSTGSNPNILLGVKAGSVNRDIRIARNRFTCGNHGNIVIGTTGIDGLVPEGGFCNERIVIEANSFSRAGCAVFVYKGRRYIQVRNNRGQDFSSFGLGCDTHAAGTDPDRRHYLIDHVEFIDNELRGITAAPSFQARGIVIKGGVDHAVVAGNIIDSVVSRQNQPTYGIIVTQDQHARPATGRDIRIEGNVVRNVSSTAATGAWALAVGSGSRDVRILANTFDTAQRGVRLDNGAEWTFSGNTLKNLASREEAPISIRNAPATVPLDKRLLRNRIERGKGVKSTAVLIFPGVSKLAYQAQTTVGFAREYSAGANARIGRLQ